MADRHTHYMQQALRLAERGRGTVSPNPMVGCVIVRDDVVVGEGWHTRAGLAHAEVLALDQADQKALGATAYVTLEPCAHHGRTPPCTSALINAGVKEVVIACGDPNPLVAGNGVKALQDAGINVITQICHDEAVALNEVFFHYIKTKRPFVIAKWAMSLDGKTITHPHDERKITSAAAHKHVHTLRQHVDAIIVGKQTAITDNPQLTSRLTNQVVAKQPIRIVITSNGDLPLDLNLFQHTAKTIVVTTKNISEQQQQALLATGHDVLITKMNTQQQVDLDDMLMQLGQREITSVLVEGGQTLHQAFFARDLVNRVDVYLAPVIIAGLEKKKQYPNMTVNQIENDYYFKTY